MPKPAVPPRFTGFAPPAAFDSPLAAWQQARANHAAADEEARDLFRCALDVLAAAYGPDEGVRCFDQHYLDCCRDRHRAAPATAAAKQPIAANLRRQVFERDAYRCKHCGDWHDLCADHIVPESRGGATTLANLQTLCRSCNSRKGVSM